MNGARQQLTRPRGCHAGSDLGCRRGRRWAGRRDSACDIARKGHTVVLLDKTGRIKPCGGAIPPRLIRDFQIPVHLLCARIQSARMIPPSAKYVDMPIDGGFVGMVNRETFDEWLRAAPQPTSVPNVGAGSSTS